MFTKLGLVALIAITGAVILAHPDETAQKIHSTGRLAGGLVQETVNVAGDGINSLQNLGGNGSDGTEPTTPTTAPPVGSGQG